MCLIPFYLWQERDINVLDGYFESIKKLKSAFNEHILNTNPRKECEADPYGIYHDEMCHYYMALKRLCVKIKLQMSEENPDLVESAQYAAGCFENEEASLFKNTQVGQYYDYGHEVSVEVRSDEDPYMVFSYSKYNLGTDFTVFRYLSYLAIFTSIFAVFNTFYMFCFGLERRNDDSTAAPKSAGGGTEYDSEMIAYRSLGH